MIWVRHGNPIPLHIYHGVPKGWCAAEIVAEHERLCGQFDIRGPQATEPGAPSWLPERYEWLQYRATLYRIADGVRAGDAACTELAVRFIELRHIGSYSGFVRALLGRRLKHALLTEAQRNRLHAHFSTLVLNNDRSDEFSVYAKLWRLLITPAGLQALVKQLEQKPDGKARATWLLGKLRLAPSSNLGWPDKAAPAGHIEQSARIKSSAKVRWVAFELRELKRAADEAGVAFRAAKRHCFDSNVQYYMCRQICKMKPIASAYYTPSPERLAQTNAESAAHVRHRDAERQAARVALDAARLNLDKAVWLYKEAKSRAVRQPEN